MSVAVAASIETEGKATLARMAKDWRWRITSGALYVIKVKSENPDDPGTAIPFRPNGAQNKLLDRLHHRNLIVKGRQLGMTTCIVIMGLDHALWNANQNVVIQAHTEPAAEEIFRDKVRFAYDSLPAFLKQAFPLTKSTESQLVFGHNGSSIRVVTSARSGTAHFLHVSEMGKVAANDPGKAREIVSGSLQAVPLHGLAFIESTAEGKSGAFYEMARRAETKWKGGLKLGPQDWRFHFLPWWVEPTYKLSREQALRVTISPKDHAYFDTVEGDTGCILTLGQRAWYVAKREEEFAHEPELMWREYPSTAEEPWKTGTEGLYLHAVLSKARAEGRIGHYPVLPDRPLNGFWDLGASDTQTLWLHQRHGMWHHFPAYRESISEGVLPFIQWVETFNAPVGTMYLPHDASHLINGIQQPRSLVSQCQELKPSWRWVVVPRVTTIQHGIDLMRTAFATYRFDEEGCKEGLAHLGNYKRAWNNRLQAWADGPQHDDASHATDALRQHAQGYEDPPAPIRPRPRTHTSGMVA